MKKFRIVLLPLAILLVALAAQPASAAVTSQVTNNYYFGCALLNSGAVKCWTGYNNYGSLGNGTFDQSAQPVDVQGISTAVDISSGDGMACVVLADTTVRCWGENSDGSLGNPDVPSHSNVPVAATGVIGAKQIAGSDFTFCVATHDGRAICWGDNDQGQLNTGGTVDLSTPAEVNGFGVVTKIAAGPDNVCALNSLGGVRCTGENDQGEVGSGAEGPDVYTPTDVVGLSGVLDITVGNEFACALLGDQTVKCWGSNSDGALGTGTSDSDPHPTPLTVPGLTSVVSVAAGYNNVCALIADGGVKCWGANSEGQAGGGVTSTGAVPTSVHGLPAKALALSKTAEATPCVILVGGGVYCWGQNNYNQAGNFENTNRVLTPFAVPGVNVNVLPYAGSGAAVAQVGKSKLDKKKKNYSTSASLSFAPSAFLDPAVACSGAVNWAGSYKYSVTKTVKSKGKKRKKKVTKTKKLKRTSALTLANGVCATTASFTKLPVKYIAGKKLTLTASFLGSAYVEPLSASKTVKIPKPKKAKKKSKKKSKK